jgi:hypothetical protein
VSCKKQTKAGAGTKLPFVLSLSKYRRKSPSTFRQNVFTLRQAQGERLRLFEVVLQKARTGGVGFDNVPALPLRCWSGFSRPEKGLAPVVMLFAIRAKGIGPEDPPTKSRPEKGLPSVAMLSARRAKSIGPEDPPTKGG